MSLVKNEQWRLTATWLNGVAIAAVAVGTIAPLAAAMIGTASFPLALLSGTIGSEEADRMSAIQFFALFVWPFIVLGIVLGFVWFLGWQDARAAPHPSSGSSPRSSIPNPDRPT